VANPKNMITVFILLAIVNVFGVDYVDPQGPMGNVFYFTVAVMTGFMFPFFKVVEVEE
jgi:hypothetical protein